MTSIAAGAYFWEGAYFDSVDSITYYKSHAAMHKHNQDHDFMIHFYSRPCSMYAETPHAIFRVDVNIEAQQIHVK
jgi:hypothetical protein